MAAVFLVAGAHFLALLSPGPDFFLVLRSALRQGRRQANAVCVGIALANGVYIALAVTGVALLQPGSAAFSLALGRLCVLAWLGWVCVRAAGETFEIQACQPSGPGGRSFDGPRRRFASSAGTRRRARERWFRERSDWLAAFSSGFCPASSTPRTRCSTPACSPSSAPSRRMHLVLFGYGVWMFSVVLGWDMFVARMAGHPAVVGRMAAHAGRFSLVTGAVFFVLAALLAWGADAGLRLWFEGTNSPLSFRALKRFPRRRLGLKWRPFVFCRRGVPMSISPISGSAAWPRRTA